MKKLALLSTVFLLSTALLAQKGKTNQEKSRDAVLGTGSGSTTEQPTTTKKGGDKESRAETSGGHNPVLGGTAGKEKGNGGSGAGKASKNQPAKVRAAFARDYPDATGVSWSKYQGDWTATFNQGVTRSTAVYHANGERRDTRTVIPQSQAPRTILEGIKRRPGSRIGEIIRIEAPQLAGNIFRVKATENGTTRYLFYNADGKQVSYDY